MAKIGMAQKFSTLQQQRENAQLELIIDKFALAMRRANREHVGKLPICPHDSTPRFTYNMQAVWAEYAEFCRTHPE